MKYAALLSILVLGMFYSFQTNEPNNSLILSGKIENPNSDSLMLIDQHYNLIETIALNENNAFRVELNLPEGFYMINDGTERTTMYLKPNFDLHLTLNTEEFDETIVYTGSGANENNYLAKDALLEESFGNLTYYGYYAKLDEKDFLNLTDSLFKVKMELLNNTKELDKDFKYVISKSLEFEKLEKCSNYESMKRFVTGDSDFNVSENFPIPFDKIDLENEKLIISHQYISYIKSYFGNKIKEDDNTEDVDYTLKYIQSIINEVNSLPIKEKLLYDAGKYNLNYTKNLDVVFNTILPYLKNEKFVEDVTEKYITLKKVEKGADSPTFEFQDIDGKTVSLNDLKGSLVYIDIWATWCMPCIKEIPSLKELTEQYKDKEIHFVSICTSDTEENWRKMVKEKELSGIQLFAPKDNQNFFNEYSVEGIPRFILLDRNGKIIDSDAKRPSNSKLKEEIEENL